MKDLELWAKVILILGGGFITFIGLVWYRVAQGLRYLFGAEVNPEVGFRVMTVGFVMLMVGIALFLQWE